MYANNRRRLLACLELPKDGDLPAGLVRQVEHIEECLEKLNQHHKIPDTEIAMLAASYVTLDGEEKPEKKEAPVKKEEKKEDPFPESKKSEPKKKGGK